eukprot:1805308-Amphidinium_carterae.1
MFPALLKLSLTICGWLLYFNLGVLQDAWILVSQLMPIMRAQEKPVEPMKQLTKEEADHVCYTSTNPTKHRSHRPGCHPTSPSTIHELEYETKTKWQRNTQTFVRCMSHMMWAGHSEYGSNK